VDVAEIIPRLFNKDRKAGERLLDGLCTDANAQTKYLTLLCGRLLRAGSDATALPQALDITPEKPFALYHTFYTYLTKSHQIWVPKEAFTKLCAYLDPEKTLKLTAAYFKKFDFEALASDAFTPTWAVSKSEFLQAIIRLYEEYREAEARWLDSLFYEHDTDDLGYLTEPALQRLVGSVDDTSTQAKLGAVLQQLFTASTWYETGEMQMTIEQFTKFAYRYNLGGASLQPFKTDTAAMIGQKTGAGQARKK
jgi:hypothetical protein